MHDDTPTIVARYSRVQAGKPSTRVRTILEHLPDGTYRIITRWRGDYGPARKVLSTHTARVDAVSRWRREYDRDRDRPYTRDLRIDKKPLT